MGVMKKSNRSFMVLNQHTRWKRIWRFLFTGWGLIMIGALISGAIFTKQILWTPISVINMADVVSNQFKISDAHFSGTDQNGEPFELYAVWAKQEYNEPDIVQAYEINGTFIRIDNDKKITDKIKSDWAEYNKKTKKIKFYDNVNVKSDNGDTIITDELIIQM